MQIVVSLWDFVKFDKKNNTIECDLEHLEKLQQAFPALKSLFIVYSSFSPPNESGALFQVRSKESGVKRKGLGLVGVACLKDYVKGICTEFGLTSVFHFLPQNKLITSKKVFVGFNRLKLHGMGLHTVPPYSFQVDSLPIEEGALFHNTEYSHFFSAGDTVIPSTNYGAGALSLCERFSVESQDAPTEVTVVSDIDNTLLLDYIYKLTKKTAINPFLVSLLKQLCRRPGMLVKFVPLTARYNFELATELGEYYDENSNGHAISLRSILTALETSMNEYQEQFAFECNMRDLWDNAIYTRTIKNHEENGRIVHYPKIWVVAQRIWKNKITSPQVLLIDDQDVEIQPWALKNLYDTIHSSVVTEVLGLAMHCQDYHEFLSENLNQLSQLIERRKKAHNTVEHTKKSVSSSSRRVSLFSSVPSLKQQQWALFSQVFKELVMFVCVKKGVSITTLQSSEKPQVQKTRLTQMVDSLFVTPIATAKVSDHLVQKISELDSPTSVKEQADKKVDEVRKGLVNG